MTAAPAHAATRHGVQVELGLTAKHAIWTPPAPGSKAGGHLRLERVAPRMTMMEVAPQREVATVPVSQLGANWRRLFGAHGGQTNAILSATDVNGRQLFPVRLRLVHRNLSGKRMTFAAVRLKHTGHRSPGLGGAPRTFDDVSLEIDPLITDKLKALWNSLLGFWNSTPTVPSNPTDKTGNGTGPAIFNRDGSYAGPEDAAADTPAAWRQVEQQNFNAAGGNWTGDLTEDSPDLAFNGGTYEGLALFNHDFGALSFNGNVSNLALFESTAGSVSVNNAEVGGANLRGLVTDGLNVSNSAFDGLDLRRCATASHWSSRTPTSPRCRSRTPTSAEARSHRPRSRAAG